MTNYYLVIDHDDPHTPYYIINQKATRWSEWQPTIELCFDQLISDSTGLGNPASFDNDNETVIPITLPRYSYVHFSDLYPEYLV